MKSVAPTETVSRFIGFAAWALVALHQAGAENIVYPSAANVSDVTAAPYYADNQGGGDATSALNTAFQADPGSNWAMGIVYLPNGTYHVSGALTVRTLGIGPHIVGQSTEGTVILLDEGTFTDAQNPQTVLSTGEGVAQNFNRGLFNLTVRIGANNPGAIGVHWYGNNEALMSDVAIVSQDGQGEIGLDLTGAEEGPCMVRRVHIDGFRYGVKCAALNAVIMMDVSLRNQSYLGIQSQTCPLYIDSLYSDNQVRAVYNHMSGFMVLVNATLVGGTSSTTAIGNDAGSLIFARDIHTQGYSKALYCPSTTQVPPDIPEGNDIYEFSSHGYVSQFPSAQNSLRLDRKSPPEPAWEQDVSRWAFVNDYQGGGNSDAQALQAAIDDQTKTTVCIPRGLNLSIDGAVHLRGNISRLLGTGGTIRGSGSLLIDDGTPQVVKIEKIGTRDLADFPITVQTSRTVVMESILDGQSGVLRANGTGELYLTDVLALLEVTNSSQEVWAWHFNAEGNQNEKLVVSDGSLRLFGWKTEADNTKINITGGTVELLGFLYYVSGCVDRTGLPMMTVADAEVCIVSLHQINFCDPGSFFPLLVRETKDYVTMDLTEGVDVPVYVSHDRETRALGDLRQTENHLKVSVRLSATRTSGGGPDLLLSYSLGQHSLVAASFVNSMGRIVRSTVVGQRSAGTYTDALPIAGAAPGVYQAQLRAGDTERTATVVVE